MSTKDASVRNPFLGQPGRCFGCGGTIPFDAHTRCNGMRQHVFQQALAFRHLGDFNARLWCHALIGARLKKFPHPHPARIAGSPVGGKNVVGTNGLVTIGYRSLFSNEERPIVGKLRGKVVRVPNVQFKVLRRVAVAQLDGFVFVVGRVDHAMIPPCQTGNLAGRQIG